MSVCAFRDLTTNDIVETGGQSDRKRAYAVHAHKLCLLFMKFVCLFSVTNKALWFSRKHEKLSIKVKIRTQLELVGWISMTGTDVLDNIWSKLCWQSGLRQGRHFYVMFREKNSKPTLMLYIHGPAGQDKCLWCWSSVNSFVEDPLDKKSVERLSDITCSLAGTSLVYMFISCNVREGHACVGALTKLVILRSLNASLLFPRLIDISLHDLYIHNATFSWQFFPQPPLRRMTVSHRGLVFRRDRLQSQSLMGHHSERQLSLMSWPSRPFPLLSLLTMFVHKKIYS